MTSLQPTPSRGLFRRIPLWAVVVVAALIGLLLIGAGLILTTQDDKPKTPAAPACTPVPTSTTPPRAADITVNVYNATDRDGLARTTADALEERDFKIDAVTNDPKKATVRGSAVVRHAPDAELDARWVAAQVPRATLQVVSATGRAASSVDLVIGEKYDKLATEPAAAAAFVASSPLSTC